MEDRLNFQYAATPGQPMQICSPSRSNISMAPINFPYDTWSTIGNKRQFPEECFSANKRKKNTEEGAPNKIIDSITHTSISQPPKTPVSAKKSHDRFIPNRNGLDIDYNFYQLTKSSAAEQDTKFTPSQRKLKEELDILKSGEKRRIMECRSTLTPQFDRVATPIRVCFLILFHISVALIPFQIVVC